MNKKLLFTAIISFTLTLGAFAQIVGGEAFLQGTYLEVGVSSCGSYGTTGAAPAGYHENPAGGGLGFVADPAADGWAVGTPAYFGDYFLPGSPLEGWGIEFGGNTYFNANDGTICTSSDIPGSITGYSNAGGVTSANWDGAIGGVDISMRTWFPTGALYFITDVTLYNTTGVNIYDVYFLRHVDPDNEQTNSGDFTTDQEIISQPGISGCAALVSAIGLVDSAFLGLGAMHPNAIASFSDGLGITLPANIEDLYNGVSPSFITGTDQADEPISLAFKFDTLLAGDSITFSYAYILQEDQLGEALSQTTGSSVTANGVNITSTLNFNYCPLNPIAVTLVVKGGSGWVWTPPTGLNTVIGDSVIAAVTGDMEYVVSGIDDLCGHVVKTITINADSNLIADASPDQVICNGDSIQLHAQGEPPFQWLPSIGLSDPNIANPMCYVTSDQVYVLNTTCGFDIVNVNVVPDFSTSIAQPDTICVNGSTPIVLSSSPASVGIDSILWADTSTLNTYFGANVIASPPATTNYYATITSVDGCVVEDTVTVIVSGVAPNIEVNPANSTICEGVEVALDVDLIIATTDYLVSSTAYSTVSGSGTSVILSDDQLSAALPIGFSFEFYGNLYTDFFISSNGYITFTTGFNSGCCSGQLLPNPFDPNNLIAFAWEDLNPGAGGTIEYFVTGTAPNQALVVNFIGVPHFGGGDFVNAQVVLYESSNQVVINLTDMPGLTGNHTLGLENFDGTEATTPVGHNSQPWSAINESWSFVPLDPNENITYTWTPSTYLDVDTGMHVLSNPTANITYTVTADNGLCVSTAIATITVDTSLHYISGSDDVETCNLTPQEELYIEATSNNALTYTWTPSASLNVSNADTVIASPTSTTCYVASVQSASGTSCVIYDTICIVIGTDFSFDSATVVDASCFGIENGSMQLYSSDGVSPISYSIDNGATSQLSDNFSSLSAGTYNVVVTDDENCVDIGTVSISEPSQILISSSTEDTACFNSDNGSVEVTVSGGTSLTGDYTYNINGGTNITSSSPFTVGTVFGDSAYVLEVLDDNSCLTSSSIMAEEYSEVIVTIYEDTCLYINETVTLSSSGSYVTYSWTPTTGLSCSDCPNPTVSITQSTEYSLSVIDANGCSSVKDASVNVCLLLSEIVIPNAFTPNGDDLNDRFFSKKLIPSGYVLKSIRIYNRWGDLVYDEADNAGWDGTINGKDQLTDLYLYYVEFETADGEIVKYNGNISLLR